MHVDWERRRSGSSVLHLLYYLAGLITGPQLRAPLLEAPLLARVFIVGASAAHAHLSRWAAARGLSAAIAGVYAAPAQLSRRVAARLLHCGRHQPAIAPHSLEVLLAFLPPEIPLRDAADAPFIEGIPYLASYGGLPRRLWRRRHMYYALAYTAAQR